MHLVATIVEELDTYLAVDIIDVGETLRSIALKAVCVVADVSMQLSTVRYHAPITA